MEISTSRFELALKELKPSDWERFEKLASAFLASEWLNIRTMASASGDGGRDSELFCADKAPNVVIQYSVTDKWGDKIRQTIKRLKELSNSATSLVYLSSKRIGAQADDIKRELSERGIHLDVRDCSWFIERANTDLNRSNAATELARLIVDPLLESKKLIAQSGSALSGEEARTAFLFLEMQWHNESAAKGLTKSSFDALVRGALHGTSSDERMKRQQVYNRIGEFLPQHPATALKPYIDGSLQRLAKSAIRHWPKDDEFNLAFEETERLGERAAAIKLLKDAFEADVMDLVEGIGTLLDDAKNEIALAIKMIIEKYFLQRGEEFASALARDDEPSVDVADLNSIVVEVAPAKRLRSDTDNVNLLTSIVSTFFATASDRSKEYLKLLSDSYTLFAFLEEVPDVQRVTKKLFTHGTIWLDTSVLLPIFAEVVFPESLRPFTDMFRQAKAANAKLVVTLGILEEIDSHFHICELYSKSDNWKGRVPYLYTRYILAGGAPGEFSRWVEQFRGQLRPADDIADYLLKEFNIEVEAPLESADVGRDIISGIQIYWQEVQHRRRGPDGGFNMTAHRLAAHDAENCISVISERRKEAGKPSPFGYTSWWLTLDSAAKNMMSKADANVAKGMRASPVMSVDFLLKYCAFGPNRDRIGDAARRHQFVFSNQILETLPKELVEIAGKVRTESKGLSERIIQRRIRDALDWERLKQGVVQEAGLDNADEAIAGMF